MYSRQNQVAVSSSVDALCDRFEAALKSGSRPSLESFLNEAGPDATQALEELVVLKLDYRIRTGESGSASDYFDRFPQLLADQAVAVRLVGAEFRAKKDRDPHTSEAEFRRRYPELANSYKWSDGPWFARPVPETRSLPIPIDDTTNEQREANVEPIEFLKDFLDAPERPGDIGRLGDYHIRGVLGAGGMGVVLVAEDPTLRRTVAIKLMRPEIAATPRAKERFLREARSAAAVEHPRVVVIHHVGEWHGSPFLVMPLLAGRSLARRLKDGPPIPLADAVRFVREAVDGLAAAHTKGLIHRDIKPDNIWLEDTAEGTHVRLLDFGLARGDDSEPLTRQGAVVGTPHYMSPEQADGQTVDFRSDLFSLGCVLYELLTGRRAFSGSTLLSVLSSLANHHPRPPRDVQLSVPAELSDLTMRMLEKAPGARPVSASAVSEKLRRLESELANIGETRTFETERPPVPALGRPTWAWASAAALGLVAVALIGWYVSRNKDLRPSISPHSTQQPVPFDSTTQSSNHVAEAPLRVMAIEMNHFARTPEGDVPQGLLGQKTFTPLLGDRVQVKAKLWKPAYAYLIAFRADGMAELCFPESEDTPPPLTDSPKYPLTNGLKAYGLGEGTGLWVFAVVASDDPLPTYRDWLQERFDNKLGWQSVSQLPAGIVWWDDGSTHVEHFTASGNSPITRSKDEMLEGPAAAIKRLTDSLRTTGQAGTASAIGFAVAPRE